MVMVDTDPIEVDRRLATGGLACPGCGGRLRPWGHARWRTTRGADRDARHLECSRFFGRGFRLPIG